MRKIAIVGNIACGKSTVENMLRMNGFTVFDSDELSHEILENSEIKVKEAFKGLDIEEDGKLSRQKLGLLVFKNKDLKSRLENIIYPQLREKIEKIFIENLKMDFVFISIPLLFEVGWQDLFDNILFISTDEGIRLKRLMKRNNLSEEDALCRIKSQLDEVEKIKNSDFVICNNEDISNLQKEINKFIILLRTME